MIKTFFLNIINIIYRCIEFMLRHYRTYVLMSKCTTITPPKVLGKVILHFKA